MKQYIREKILNLTVSIDKVSGKFILGKDILVKKYSEPYVLIAKMN